MNNRLAAIFMVWLCVMTCGTAFGEGFVVEITANESVIEGRIGLELELTPNFITFGAGFITNEDDYSIYGADVSFGAVWIDNLKITMGFKGVIGTYDHFPENASIGAVGFLIAGDYDLGYGDAGFPFDVGVSGRLCIAPEPLSFNDSEKYNEFELSLNFHLLQQRAGSVLIGYRMIRMSFDPLLNISDESDNAAFIGYRLRF